MTRKVFSISLPQPLCDFVKKRVRASGYASASEYIRELIRGDQRAIFGEDSEYSPSQRLAISRGIYTEDLTKALD